MGVVYRARDTKLLRNVAIKILPPEVVDDPGRLARFRREAHVLASLNHPHIAAIYGFEEAEGQPFLVMELVEGEDLSRRLTRGRIPLDEAMEIARQTAEAVEAAHEKGIVHRDLKPGNIVISEDGQVKVLDFGLAKAFAGDAAETASSDLSQSPTISRHETATGVILGTAAYMSPEQARGKQVDKRADIWAFGVVLFEMLTGRPLFSGETVSDVLASVLRAEPDWARLPGETPPSVRRLLRRCLVRDPKARLRDIGDARLELAEMDQAPIASPRRARWLLPGVLLLFGILLGFAIAKLREPERGPLAVRRATIKLERPLALFTRSDRLCLALSPDGSHLVYRAWAKDVIGPPLRLEGSEKDDTLLYLRRLDELESKPIAGTEGAYLPFFSPDGEWIGFFAGGKLMKVPLGGGVPTSITDAPDSWGAVWAQGGTIIFNPQSSESLRRVPDSGGTPEVLTSLDVANGEQEHDSPFLLPDGDTLLFGAWTSSSARLEAMSLKTGRRKTLVEGNDMGIFALGSHVVYTGLTGDLLTASFDASAGELLGPPQPVLTELLIDPFWFNTQWTLSPDGTLVYAAGSRVKVPSRLVWVDRDGRLERLTEDARNYDRPRLSPDGRRIVYATFGDEHDIWIYDLSRATHTRLTFSESAESDPLWSPDGSRIVFASTKLGGNNLLWKSADGSGDEELLGEQTRALRIPGDFTPDGRLLAFHELGAHDWGLGVFEREGSTVRPSVNTPSNEQYPRLSPDGRWVAFQTDVSGRMEVVVTRFPEPAATHPISDAGGRFPFWSKRGDELFYQSLDGRKLMAVSIRTEPELEAGRPRVLFETGNVDVWDVDLDGKRFLGVERPELATITELQVVFNWGEELKRLVPAN